MPCEKCGSTRFIYKNEIFCPKCDNISIQDASNEIIPRESDLSLLQQKFKELLGKINYNSAFGSTLVNRELAAKTALFNVEDRRYAIREWLVFNTILNELHYVENVSDKNSDEHYKELVEICRTILHKRNELYYLKNNLAFIATINNTNLVVYNENMPIMTLFEPSLIKRDIDKKGELFGYYFMQSMLLHEFNDVFMSEDISSYFNYYNHNRILPFLNKENSQDFINISMTISVEGSLLNYFNKKDQIQEGLVLTNEDGLKTIKYNLSKKYNKKLVDWYFNSLFSNRQTNLIKKDEENGLYAISLFSLQFLSYAASYWLKDTTYGNIKNHEGKAIEIYLFICLHSFDIITKHPLSGSDLLRVPNPDNNKIEIADIMGYNKDKILVVESKFWNKPIIADIEKELKIFKDKIMYINNNLTKFGFHSGMNIISFFYSPYLFYLEWDGITIIHDILEYGTKLYEIFGEKQVSLITNINSFKKYLDYYVSPIDEPMDLSEIDSNIKENSYRIQDGLFYKLDEKEITMILDMPFSESAIIIYFDINEASYNEIKNHNLSKGDVIRFITYNLSGTWSMTQFLCCKKINSYNEILSSENLSKIYYRLMDMYKYITSKREDVP